MPKNQFPFSKLHFSYVFLPLFGGVGVGGGCGAGDGGGANIGLVAGGWVGPNLKK